MSVTGDVGGQFVVCTFVSAIGDVTNDVGDMGNVCAAIDSGDIIDMVLYNDMSRFDRLLVMWIISIVSGIDRTMYIARTVRSGSLGENFRGDNTGLLYISGVTNQFK
jgi:hypothetical protein